MDLNLINFKKLEQNADLIIKKKFSLFKGSIIEFYTCYDKVESLVGTFYPKTLCLHLNGKVINFNKFSSSKNSIRYEALVNFIDKNLIITLEGLSYLKNKIRNYNGIIGINNSLFEFYSMMLFENHLVDKKKSTKNIVLFVNSNNEYSKFLTLYRSSTDFKVIYHHINLFGNLKNNIDIIAIIMICNIFSV